VIRVAACGAAGRMGRLVLAEILDDPDLALAAALERPGHPEIGRDAGVLAGHPPAGVALAPLAAPLPPADVLVDFSLPEGTAALLDALEAAPVPLVTGTTGLDPALQARLLALSRRVPVVAAANFSTGVAVLLDLAARAAAALPGFDVEIVETHHRRKADAPSGTALALGRAIATARGTALQAVHGRSGRPGEREAGPIGFHALRGGDVVGDHRVLLLGEGERLELGHVAGSRLTFARGALAAARWVVGREPGLYGTREVLGLGG
jgi:4-hydroxy-tetrahydrodipicolinate reductase